MIDYTKILSTHFSDKEWVTNGDSYDGLDWRDETPKPTKDQLDALWLKITAEYDAKQYQRDRAKEYPSIQEQLDMQYWDSVNGTTTWQDAINAVKAKYPKGA